MASSDRRGRRVELHGCPEVLVTQHPLHSFRIDLQLDRRRSQRMPEVVKAESDLLAFLDDSCFIAAGRRYFCTRFEADSGFLPFRRVLGNTKSSSLAYGVFSRQASRKPARRGCVGTGTFDAFDFGTLNLPHWAGDTARSLVCEICEETDDPNEQHEVQCLGGRDRLGQREQVALL